MSDARTVDAGSSPLTRGAPRTKEAKHLQQGIIPAHAGSTSDSDVLGVEAPDHPRSRGEHYQDTPQRQVRAGSSPLTRGAPLSRHNGEASGGIIPAHAGSTLPDLQLYPTEG